MHAAQLETKPLHPEASTEPDTAVDESIRQIFENFEKKLLQSFDKIKINC